MELWLLYILAPMLYAFMGGVIGMAYQTNAIKSCDRDNHYGSYSWCNHSCWVIPTTLVWPLMFPYWAGTKIGSIDMASRTTRRRAKEIEEAKHRAELARIRAEETAQLERAMT